MADNVRRIVAEFSAKNKAKGEMAGFRQDMDRTRKSMINMAKGALAMVGLGGGLYAIKRGFDYVTKAGMKQEDALFLLGAALKATGDYSVEAMRKYEGFAASIQQATVYGDEEVLALMQLMKSLGVTSARLEQATKMAIGLAAATGRDVKSMSMYIALAQQGEFTMLRRYIPALRSTTDATEQLRIITEFAARGFKIAEAQAETTSGSIMQMWNAVSDLAEVMSKPILEPMKKDVGSLTILIEEATKALTKYQEAAVKIRETREKIRIRPMGFPRVPMPDIKERFGRHDLLAGQLADQAWAMKEVAKAYPEWVKALNDLNTLTEAQKKAAASMYEMSMKARGLGDELAREKEITQFAALAKVRYGADVAGAQAAQERFRKALRESDETKARKQAAAEEIKIVDEAAERQKRIAEDIAMSMARSWSNAIDQMMFEGKEFWDAMSDMARSLQREIFNIIMYKKLAEPIAYGIMGIPLAGVGGESTGVNMPAGVRKQLYAPSGHRGIPADFMPRLHGGLRSNEFPAIIERGEEIIPKADAGSSRQPPTIIFNNNNTGVNLMQDEPPRFDGKNWVVTVVSEAIDTDISFRRKLGIKS